RARIPRAKKNPGAACRGSSEEPRYRKTLPKGRDTVTLLKFCRRGPRLWNRKRFAKTDRKNGTIESLRGYRRPASPKAAHGLAAELFFVRNTAIPMQPNWQHNCGHTFPWRGVRGSVGGPTVKFLTATRAIMAPGNKQRIICSTPKAPPARSLTQACRLSLATVIPLALSLPI